MAEAAFKKEEDFFHQQIGLQFEEETSEVLHFGIEF
jgi:hypothetical protein